MTGPRLFNTLTRAVEPLLPLAPPAVGVYTCGPTVYDFQHLGNYRTYVFEDSLVRCLRLLGLRPRRVMNITDVGHMTSQADEGEDKMEVGAARDGKTAWEIAALYTKAFLDDFQALNNLPPDVLCKATDHIPEQLELVRRLEARGCVYRISDGMYFDTARFAGYGALAGAAHQEGLRAGARVEANPEKRNPADFAVWKFSPAGRKRHMEWASPWGRGFPGWHIECSAMAMKYLGESFDIHCGGVDHIPIHHTNEIAQAEAATGKPFVRVWLHGEFLLLDSAKMAKSSGGFIKLADLAERGFGPLDYRYLCLTAHYRKQLDFSWESLDAAKSALKRLRDRVRVVMDEAGPAAGAGAPAEWAGRLRAAAADDLDMPGALAALWDGLKPGAYPPAAQAAMAGEADALLGLKLLEGAGDALPPELQALLDRRQQARARRDFAGADALRRELETRGVVLEDTAKGTRWKRR